MVRKPSKAGISLFSSTEPLNARFPNSETPMDIVALFLAAFVEPSTPQTLLRPGWSSTIVVLPASVACFVTLFGH
eukprot:6854550-Prorocentrum_lima.AAC.1